MSRDKLIGSFDQIAAGHWGYLIDASHKCAQEAVTAFRRRPTKIDRPRCTLRSEGFAICPIGRTVIGPSGCRRS